MAFVVATMAMPSARKMPTLSLAIAAIVGPSTAVWSRSTLVSTVTTPSMTLVESHVPPMPTSMTATSTPSSEKCRNAAAVKQFEPGEGDAAHRLHVGQTLRAA